MFEMASQYKFRYPWKGMITTEDLWDLNVKQLDAVYQALSKEMNALQDGDSLLSTTSADVFNKKQDLTTKIEIVKYIFNCKQQAAELNRMAAERSAKKQRIMDILAQKQENALQNMSEDELKKMLDELG
jgi:hypothetical protein